MKILLQVALVFGIYWVSQGIEAVLPVAFPASVISLPAKANTEDHISNSCFAARRTRTVLENAQTVVAAEMLLACTSSPMLVE